MTARRRLSGTARWQSQKLLYRAKSGDNSSFRKPNMARASNLTMCSFCGKSHAEVRKLIAGPGVYICDSCINVCKSILDKELNEDARRQSSNIRVPKTGRNPALARSICDRPGRSPRRRFLWPCTTTYKRVLQTSAPTDASAAFQPDPFADVEIEKSNILLIGPTGSGKDVAGQDAWPGFSMCHSASPMRRR